MTAHLRILPLIDATEYRELAETVGAARVSAGPITGGLRAVLGIGREARLRRELSGLVGNLVPGGRRFSFDWLGKWVMLGVADRPGLAVAAHRLGDRELPERPALDEEEERERDDEGVALRKLPAYAAIDLRSTAAASLALLAVRKLAQEAMPGMVKWGELERYREVAIVQVNVREERRSRTGQRSESDDIDVFYAIAEGALLLSLQHDLVRGLIDQQLDGTGARAQGRDSLHGQLIVDVAAAERQALWTVLGWVLEHEARETAPLSRADARVVLRGAPELRSQPDALRALTQATLGRLPVTPDGGSYGWTPSGVRDSVRGTMHAPRWPAVPVDGSPTAALLGAVASFRSELAFDDEGKTPAGERMRSLRVRLRLGLRH
jgi:hypothetical protein